MPSSATTPGTLGTILVVDDEHETRAVLTEHLTRQGYTVAEAADATQALRYLRDARPDMMLLDVCLPGMNGLALLDRVRRDHPSTRVIMITGLDDEALARSMLRLGATDYLRKPFDFDYLDRAVHAALVVP